jgi:SsrA-binding protein
MKNSTTMRPNGQSIIYNKAAKFHYDLHEGDDLEVGIVLKGSEVKSLRMHNPNIMDAYAFIKDGELFVKNLDIPVVQFSREKHDPKGERKLLLHKKELAKISGKLIKGSTIIPLSLYFNKRGFVKMKISIAKGKKLYDKRREQKEKDIKRETLRSAKIAI